MVQWTTVWLDGEVVGKPGHGKSTPGKFQPLSARWLLVPTTRETADHSIPFLVALALLHGDVTQEDFQR